MKLSLALASVLLSFSSVAAAPMGFKSNNQISTVEVSELPNPPKGYYAYRPGTTFQYPGHNPSVKTVQKRSEDPHAAEPRYAATPVIDGMLYQHEFGATG